MIILGIDSSMKTASCGIVKDGKVIVDYTLNHKRTHSEKLLEMIDMALKIAQLDITDIDAFAVTKGPGSFTGLRIGLSTIKGLCHSLNKPCYLVSTLDSLYENVNNTYSKDIIYAPIMDARRNEVYCAAFKNGEKIIEDDALSINDFLNKISTFEFEKVDGRFGFEILCERMASKSFGAILDVYWLAYAGINPAKFIREHKDNIACIHLKDLRITDNTPCYAEIGQGNIDWDDVIAACEECGVEYALVEQDDNHMDNDPFKSLTISYEYLKEKGIV